MTRSASERGEVLNAVGEPALIINRDPVGFLLVGDTISQLAGYGVQIGPGESVTYDLTSDRAIAASTRNQPGGATTGLSVQYDVLPGGSGPLVPGVPNASYLGAVTAPNGVNPSVKFRVPGGTTAIGVFTQQAGGPASVTVIGDTTGWTSIKETIPTSAMGFFTGLVVPAADENIIVQVVNSSGFALSMFVVAYLAEPPLSENRIPHAGSTVNVPTAVPTIVLSAPSAGKLWEVVSFTYANSVAAAAGSGIFLKGTTSGNNYGTWGVLTGALPTGFLPLAAPLVVNEGLTFTHTAGVNITTVTDARQVNPA